MIEMDNYIHKWRSKQLKKLNIPEDSVDYLFISFRGGQMHTNCLNNMIKTCAKKAGLENWNKIHNHTMRTSYATQMHKAGVSDKAIQVQLGHSNISTTLGSYVQMDNDQVRTETQGKGFNFGMESTESDIQDKVREFEESLRNGARTDSNNNIIKEDKKIELTGDGK